MLKPDPVRWQLSQLIAIAQVGTKLRGFGASLLSGTTGLLEKVHDTISAELEGMEGQLTGRGRPAPAVAAAARCGPARRRRAQAGAGWKAPPDPGCGSHHAHPHL
jgi:hypothetical protein